MTQKALDNPSYSRIMTHIIHMSISYKQFLDKMITFLLLEFNND